MSTTTTDRLAALRKLMREQNLPAYYIPSEDAHQSSSIAESDSRRAFISGFTGSAGLAIVTENEAALWTDGRYFLQAEKQLDSNWKLMKVGLPETPKKEQYLKMKLKAGDKVGIDARLISFDAFIKLKQVLEDSKIELSLSQENLVDVIWTNRLPSTFNPIFLLPNEYSGREATHKILSLQQYLADNQYFGFLVTALDEVAWLFNLRGSDIPCTPNFFSYALITHGEVRIYLHKEKLEFDAEKSLADMNVIILPYQQIFADLSSLKETITKSKQKLLISNTCNAALVESVGKDLVESKPSPVKLEKAIKNKVELNGLRNSHLRDAVAVIRYLAWLEKELLAGTTIDEVDGADKLLQFRAEEKDFKGLSFDTISASGPNGAIIHYQPEKPSAAKITTDQIYLLDSGGQYLDGTTDITRTVYFGNTDALKQEKECYTRVLLGHIALDRAVFPAGTSGFTLDCLARTPLWNVGLDYRHGTGHGVGHFLNVHEGPHSISNSIRSHEHSLKAGMTVTNEPGVYLDGKFGVRIENLLIIKEANTRNNFGGTKFLKFEHITMVPMCKRLLDKSIMNENDIKWVNDFHQECWEKISPLLISKDKLALEWLRHQTLPIQEEH